MIIYNGTKASFSEAVTDQGIADILNNAVYEKMHRRTGQSELESWKNSMNYMYMVLNDNMIPDDIGVAIEYNIPQTSKRVDFIISGLDEEKKENVVIVELKQWTSLKAVKGKDALVETVTGHNLRQVVHPSYQAWSYAALIKDYSDIVQDEEIELSPCAYLHNYEPEENDPLYDEQYQDYLEEAPAFTKKDIRKLREFIKKSVVYGDNGDTIYKIDQGKIRPSKSLQDAIASMVKGNNEFIMIDDQKVVYERILEVSRQCIKDKKKRVIIVKGGPGTGKTVVAVNLLAKLTNEGQFVQYTSKNSAPRSVYLKKLKGVLRKSSIDNMFKGSGSYVDAPRNAVDTILADEAHRLNEKSGLFHNLGENQIKEIIAAAKCSVFFIDEEQRVTLQDIGSITEIRRWAFEQKAEVIEEELVSQFRCNGSDGYLAWLDQVLEIRETANYDLEGIDYDIRILDTPEEVRDLIFARNKSRNKSRLLAGYCWNWISEGKNKSDVYDIQIGDFRMSWNLGNTDTWAIDEESVNEIGCIHTAQGLEFEYVGVIIGGDMIYRDGHIVTDYTKRAKTDQSIKGIKKMAKNDPEEAAETADMIIKNTYRTLMTRGMKGCYVYCTDRELSEYLKSLLE
ncbi:MAG: DUF2075 domain-containing protein [Solobacterium sp.]|nr:DUF2075 domain-containing protein [Solobacterium sp.]